MKRLLNLAALLVVPVAVQAADPVGSRVGPATSAVLTVVSPDGRLAADFSLLADGAPRYVIRFDRRPVLAPSKLGLIRDDADFSRGLTLTGVADVQPVEDHYEILTAKRRVNTYRANRGVVHLRAAGGQPMDLVFQVSNDGVAFRYQFPETSATVHRFKEEATSYHFLPGTRAWLQPMSIAKTGWSAVNPCYEEYYEKDIPVGTPSPLAGWVYPAIFRSGGTWLVVDEGSLGRNTCATRLRGESPDGEYTVGYPDPRENFQGGPVNPESTLPWQSPWRFVAIGSLKTMVESTLGTDLADPASGAPSVAGIDQGSPAAAPPAHLLGGPGKASWSWPLLGDRNTKYDVQKRFIDYAADMGWPYCLIDGLWDQQIGYDKVKELIDYARTRHVGILLWYNSAGDWNQAPQTPRDKMLTHESRIREFDRVKAMGAVGLKIDFFGGDGQSMIAYYHDILADAAPYGFLLNFHGATLPRGWERTYPQLMTMEAVKGLEYMTFEQKNADEEPTHATTLPFGRNLFDPMDFTPMALDHIPRIQRRTTSGFELALSVVFTSGIQHYAEIPEGMAKAPDYVREFLRHVPSIWDDTKFIDGFPGKFFVVARQGEGRWYVGGINGESANKRLTLDLSGLVHAGARRGVLIHDGSGGNLSFQREDVNLGADGKLDVTLPAAGGFVMVLP